jgi:hypothetical protein
MDLLRALNVGTLLLLVDGELPMVFYGMDRGC